MVQALKFWVPAAIVPLGFFLLNWAMRHRNGYPQTASADLLLALLIYDGVVIASGDTFAPFVADSDLRNALVASHIVLILIVFVAWWAIMAWGEPAFAAYYVDRLAQHFPYGAATACWMAIAAALTLHIGYYVI